jgi:biopolymer transport protein ExbD
MLRKLIAVVVIVVVAVAGFGCKKTPAKSPAQTPAKSAPQKTEQKTEVKSQAEYDAKAKKEITSENMQAELDKIEKDVQQENKGGF